MLWGDRLQIFGDDGEQLREIRFPEGPPGEFYGPLDFCFDEHGNIYGAANVSAQVTICKFDPNGRLLGKLKNDQELTRKANRYAFLSSRIGYLRGYGLFLFHQWENIPVDFKDGVIPDLTLRSRWQQGFPVGPDRKVVGTLKEHLTGSTIELINFLKTCLPHYQSQIRLIAKSLQSILWTQRINTTTFSSGLANLH